MQNSSSISEVSKNINESEVPYLEARNLCKAYGETVVLDSVSLRIGRGRCLALLGPSGCGKSTILNILAGLLKSDSGQVLLQGSVIEDAKKGVLVSARDRRFSMVFQDLSLWPHMSVAENVGFGLDYTGVPMDRVTKKKKVEMALKLVGIHDLRHRLPAMLSGGQQQRVAIARAIVVEPSVLLMDEPLASLDTQLREGLRDEIARLIRQLHITTIYVTHDHTEAMTVAHEVAILNNGAIEQCAAPEEVYAYPASTFVAQFLGCANHFPFTYELEDLRDTTGRHVFPPHPKGVARGHLLIRREAVNIFSTRQAHEFPGEGKVRWKATCIKNSFSGSRHEIHAITRKGEVFRGFTPYPLPLDSEVFVQFDPEQAIFVES